MWSPARTCPISAVVTAAIPVAVARAAGALRARPRCSGMVMVGLEKREY
jgi:hypothetical protein